jgi:hypothetical protein
MRRLFFGAGAERLTSLFQVVPSRQLVFFVMMIRAAFQPVNSESYQRGIRPLPDSITRNQEIK